MKKMFCLLFVVSGILYGQIKPFGFWHLVQQIEVRPDAPTITATGGYYKATITSTNDGDTFLFFRGADTTSLTLIASTASTSFVDSPLTAGTYSYFSKKIVEADTSYFSSPDTALVLQVNLLPANFTAQWDNRVGKIALNATVYPDATNIEQIEVRGELFEYPINETDGESFLSVFGEPADTTLLQDAFSQYHETFKDDEIWFVTLWIKEVGKPFYNTAKQDTVWIDIP